MKKVKVESVGAEVLEIIQETIEISALQNSLVLHMILSYLPLLDLKSTRFVNKFWKQTSKITFYQRVAMRLKMPEMQGMLSDKAYNSTLENHKNFKLFINFHKLDLNKWALLLNKFESIHHNNIKSLQISAKWHYCTEKYFKSILDIFSNVNSLELNLTEYENFDWLPSDILKGFQPLLFVTKLKIEFGLFYTSEDDPSINDEPFLGFLKNLLRLTPNICELNLPAYGEEYANYIIYLKEMVKMQLQSTKGQLLFKNLEFLNFEAWDNDISNLCLKFKQPLRGLKIMKMVVSERDCLELLDNLLNKNCDTLESLEFSYDIFKLQYFEGLNFPGLPNLNRLVITVFENIPLKGDKTEDLIGIQKLLSIGSARFQEKFPKFRTLELHFENAPAIEVIELFLPNPETSNVEMCFSQITTFKISYKCEAWHQDCKFITKLKKMFPNA